MGLVEGIVAGQNNLEICHLQFTDDTIIFSSDNIVVSLLNLKSILRCFKLVSGLKVNFRKISVIGIGIDDSVSSATATSLRCKLEGLPFKVLGLPIVATSSYSTATFNSFTNITFLLAKILSTNSPMEYVSWNNVRW